MVFDWLASISSVEVASHLITLETIINKAVDEFDNVYSTIGKDRQVIVDSTEDIAVTYEQQITNKDAAIHQHSKRHSSRCACPLTQ